MLSLPVSLYCCVALLFASLVAAFGISSFAPSSCQYSLNSRCLVILLLLVITMFSDFCLCFVLSLSLSLSLSLPLSCISGHLSVSRTVCLSVRPPVPPFHYFPLPLNQPQSINKLTIYLSTSLPPCLRIIYTYMSTYLSPSLSLSLSLSFSFALRLSPCSPISVSLARSAGSWVAQIWRFLELVALRSPYNKESSILGFLLGPLIFGNSHMQVHDDLPQKEMRLLVAFFLFVWP